MGFTRTNQLQVIDGKEFINRLLVFNTLRALCRVREPERSCILKDPRTHRFEYARSRVIARKAGTVFLKRDGVEQGQGYCGLAVIEEGRHSLLMRART